MAETINFKKSFDIKHKYSLINSDTAGGDLCFDEQKNPKNRSVLYSRGKITSSFYTEDSKLYLTPKEQKLMDEGYKLNRSGKKWDCISSKIIREYKAQAAKRGKVVESRALIERFEDYRARLRVDISQKTKDFIRVWSLKELWNFSLIGAILVGMISMSLIYKYLGPQASAGDVVRKSGSGTELVLGASSVVQTSGLTVTGPAIENPEENLEEALSYVEDIVSKIEQQKKEEYEAEVKSMVKGYPIEDMLPYITKKDRIVAAFIIGIAKKESNWGKRIPTLNGRDCYNYWGYRGIRRLMGTGGHTCFNSRQDAVDTVAKRIEFLVSNNKLNTPAKMVIWKCGSACNKDNQAAVRKWISDVDIYFQKLND